MERIEKLKQQLLDAIVEELKQGNFDFVINDKGWDNGWLDITVKLGDWVFNLGVRKDDGLTAFYSGNFKEIEDAMRGFVGPAILEAYKINECRRMEAEFERLKQILNK